MARRIIYKVNGLTGSTPPTGYNFVGYNMGTFSQLDFNGNISPIGGVSGNTFESLTTGTLQVTGDPQSGYVLTSDASGNATWQPSSGGSGTSGTSGNNGTSGTSGVTTISGGLTGSGTANYLSRWTSGDTLSNSIIRDNGTTVAIGSAPFGSAQFSVISNTNYTVNFENTQIGTSVVRVDHGGTSSSNEGILVTMTQESDPVPAGSTKIALRHTIGGVAKSYGISSNVFGTTGSMINNLNVMSLTTANTQPNFTANTYNLVQSGFYKTGVGPAGDVYSVLNVNGASANNIYGVRNSIIGQATTAYGESIFVNSTANTNYGIEIGVSGDASFRNYGIYVDMGHPTDVTKDHAIYVWRGKTIFNDSGQDYDFKIKGSSNDNLFFVDASVDSIGIGTETPNSSSILHLSSTTKGFLPPVMSGSQAEAISSPAEGLIVFINNNNGVTITSTGWWGYFQSSWVQFSVVS
jgi:hypothetical protein